MNRFMKKLAVIYRKRIFLFQKTIVLGLAVGALLSLLISPVFSNRTSDPFLYQNPVSVGEITKVCARLDALKVKYDKLDVESGDTVTGYYILVANGTDTCKVRADLEKDGYTPELCMNYQ